ncbi:hypothetical protein [Methylocaldum sp.]|uniref:hypothetical protein n=1 Tax=Methylocaldum sp. TaxID=1969727 RepID=UPI002D7350BD|nr:hypothetical protein [Methylocaldum sp.]HYE36593.1 hypothetical protein [Methylocaldum sp.]
MYCIPVLSQQVMQHPRTGKGVVEVQFISSAHQVQIAFGNRTRHVINRGAREILQRALAGDRSLAD